jgi:NitT/TauT family transport system permease protein
LPKFKLSNDLQRHEGLTYGILGWLLGLLIWEIISLFSKPEIFPGPWQTLLGAIELIRDGSLQKYAFISYRRILVKEGIGYLIWTARLYFQTDWIFVGLITLGLMGFFMDKFLLLVGCLLLKKYGLQKSNSLQREPVRQAS